MTAIIVLFLRIVLAIALYAFVFYVVYSIWKELHAHGLMLGNRSFPALTLTQLETDPPSMRMFTVPEVIIGRDPACQLSITNEMVSAQHARLSFHHNQWWVEDLHSTNGTFLNGERVFTPTVLVAGDELTCGKINLEVSFSQKSN